MALCLGDCLGPADLPADRRAAAGWWSRGLAPTGVYVDGDRVPVPPTQLLDKTNLPKHPYPRDNRTGMIAPDYDLEQVDLVFLEKSVEFLESHAKQTPNQPFFLFHSAQAVHLPSFPVEEFQGKTKAGPHGDFIFELDHIVGELITIAQD